MTGATSAAVVGGLGAAGAVGGSLISSSAASGAAKTQAAASAQALAAQQAMFGDIQHNMEPYLGAGYSALPAYTAALGLGGTSAAGLVGGPNGSLISPFNPTMDQLSQTPGYQFALQQGLQSTQNGFAAQGLGASGAALKGGSQYAEGLASTTYQQQFQDYWTNNLNALNQLQTAVGGGQNAAAQLGGFGQNSVNAANAALTSGAAASAAGQVGSANALSSGLGSLGGIAQNAGLMYALQNNQSGITNALASANQQYLNPYGTTGNGWNTTPQVSAVNGLQIGGT